MREYKRELTASVNDKGVMDIDTVKGCRCGMERYPNGGCYGVCYANKIAKARGFNFAESISRQTSDSAERVISDQLKKHGLRWFRIGTMGDPSHDWPLTAYICERFSEIRRPVVVTKHWYEIPDRLLMKMAKCGTVFNTSISALDSQDEIDYRITQYHRISSLGAKSFLRVVTAKFGDGVNAKYLQEVQKWILSNRSVIDTPIRINKQCQLVVDGIVKITDSGIDGARTGISINDSSVYVGHCVGCPDQCGAN